VAHSRVLVVEDDAGIRAALAECIASLGIEVVQAVDGLAGLEAMAGDPLPRLVLLDMRMPRLDGNGFLSRMRADPRTAAVPVVSMTAWSERPSQPVHRHLAKPFDLDEIAKLLAQFCPDAGAASAI